MFLCPRIYDSTELTGLGLKVIICGPDMGWDPDLIWSLQEQKPRKWHSVARQLGSVSPGMTGGWRRRGVRNKDQKLTCWLGQGRVEALGSREHDWICILRWLSGGKWRAQRGRALSSRVDGQGLCVWCVDLYFLNICECSCIPNIPRAPIIWSLQMMLKLTDAQILPVKECIVCVEPARVSSRLPTVHSRQVPGKQLATDLVRE